MSPQVPTDPPQVTRDVDLDAPTEQVWDAIVDDEARAAWFGGPTELDATPGGTGHATDPDGTVRQIRVDEVEPGRRLAFHWWPEDGGAPSSVELVVAPRPGGTRLTVIEAPVSSPPTVHAEARTGHGQRLAVASRLLDLELWLLVGARVPALR